MRNIVYSIVCVLVSVGLVLSAQEVQEKPEELDTSIEALLARLGSYIDTYEQALTTVVSEERYRQEVAPLGNVPGQKRDLRSDLLLASAGDGSWVAFRDVFEMDGQEVRDRSDRLVDLFLKPTGDSFDQVQKIVAESSRMNLGWVSRNINVPTMVLQFAKGSEQHRSEFKRGGTTEVAAGIEAREIRFQERAVPRLILTRDGASAKGKFWIDEATGRVLRTELRINTGSTTATVLVAYAEQPQLKLWLPSLMNEQYSAPRQSVITGRAFYENFRQFNVAVDSVIKK